MDAAPRLPAGKPPVSAETSVRARPRPRRFRQLLPVKIADYYLFEAVFEGTVRGIVWFVGLLSCFAVIAAVGKLVSNTVTVWGMVQLILLQMPRIVLFTLPMSLLFGCVQAFGELSANGEATALGVGGMSLPRMMRAPLAWGAVLCVIAFGLQEIVVPRAEQERLEVVRTQILQATGIQNNFEFVQKRANGSQLSIKATRLNFRTRELTHPVVMVLNPDGSMASQITAERAIWDIQSGKWVFYHGKSQQLLPVTPRASTSSYRAPYRGAYFEIATATTVPDPGQLSNAVKSLREHLEKLDFEMVSLLELSDYRDELLAGHPANVVAAGDRDARVRGATFGIHDKIATPLICLAVVLVGCPLGLRPPRSGGGFAMGLSLIVMLTYYVVWTWFSKLGKSGIGDPVLLAYIPWLLTATIGLVLVRKKAM